MIHALGADYLVKAAAVFGVILLIAIPRRRAHHPFDRFGPANQVTALRAVIVALLAALIGEPHTNALAVAAVTAGSGCALLDGVDGWLARRSHMASAFGARFDMEVDALLILALSILAWRYEKAGAWVLASGLTRYVFVAAGILWPWLRTPLPGTIRGKTICVVQIAGLLIALLPAIASPASAWIAALSLAGLWYSFLVDIRWLWLRRSDD